MSTIQPITPCLWFDGAAEDAVDLYTSVFPNSSIGSISRYTEAGREHHRQDAGGAMSVEFTLDGQPFLALNGGPSFQFNEAVSFQVICETQDEVDHYWDRLSEGGDPAAQQCGWLKDRFGVSWQVIPRILPELINDPDPEKSRRARVAMFQMKKFDIGELQRACASPEIPEPPL